MALTLVNLPGSWAWPYQFRNLILPAPELELLAPTNQQKAKAHQATSLFIEKYNHCEVITRAFSPCGHPTQEAKWSEVWVGQDKGQRESWEANVLSGLGPNSWVHPCALDRPLPPCWTVLAWMLLWLPLDLSALQFLLLTNHLPSLGIKTCSILCSESFSEVLLTAHLFLDSQCLLVGSPFRAFAFHLLWSQ